MFKVFVKHLWTIFPALLAGVAEIFRWWWGMNQSPPHWLFWLLLIAGIALAIYLTYREIKGKQTTTDVQFPQREKAKEIHSKFMELETELWETRDKLPKGADAFEDDGVKKILASIDKELNNLTTIINKGEFEKLILTMKRVYSNYLTFHANAYKFPFDDDPQRIHSNIRWYINHIKN
jgi:hypothetical protein